jgi:hypothetical protein
MERGQDDQRRLRRRNHRFESGASGGQQLPSAQRQGLGWPVPPMAAPALE